MTTSATSCAVYAAPSRLRTSRMCRSSRESNAADPSGSVARSSSAIPSPPGRIECRPVSARRRRSGRREAVAVGRKAAAVDLMTHERVSGQQPEGVDDEDRRHGERDRGDDEHGRHGSAAPRSRLAQSPKRCWISCQTVTESTTLATRRTTSTTQNRIPARFVRLRCAMRAFRRARCRRTVCWTCS